jgi:hypothetical protein
MTRLSLTLDPMGISHFHLSIGLVVSNKKIFKISTNQNTLWALAAMLDFRSAPKTKTCIWPSNEHFCQVWFKSVLWFQKKRWKCEIPIGSYVRRPSVRPSVNFSHLNLLLWNRWTEISQTCQKCSVDGPLPDLCFWCWFEIQLGSYLFCGFRKKDENVKFP